MRQPCPKLSDESGVALIVTLAVLAIALLLVLGFTVSMRTEQIAARNFTQVAFAKQLTHAAIEDAIFLIKTNTPVITPTKYWVSQPGRIVSRGVGAPTLLFSTNSAGGTVNLNADNSIVPANAEYPNPSDRQILVEWITVGANGQAASAANPIIGRYAFWVDDEGAKININSASHRTNALAPSMKEVDLTGLQGIGGAAATNSYMFATNTGYMTTEMWKTNAFSPKPSAGNYATNRFYITAYSEGADFNPWGGKKKNLNDSANGLIRSDIDDIGNTLTNAFLTNWFGRIRGEANTFGLKFGTQNCKQILANMFDFRRAAGGNGGGAVIATGAESGYLATGGYNDNIPRWYLGEMPYSYLNEIAVQSGWFWWCDTSGSPCPPACNRSACDPFVGGGNNAKFVANVWVALELVNPYEDVLGANGQIVVDLEKFWFALNGTGWSSWWWNGYPGGGSIVQNTIDLGSGVPANSYKNYYTRFEYYVCPSDCGAWMEASYVKLNQVRLLQTAGNAQTIRDWASGEDLREDIPRRCSAGAPWTGCGAGDEQFYYANPKVRENWSPGSPSGGFSQKGPPDWNADFVQGIAKNDPSVRNFTDWDNFANARAWYRIGYDTPDASGVPTNYTYEAQNTSTVVNVGLNYHSGVTSDPSESPATMVNRSYWYAPQGANTARDFQSLGEIGFIHTGLPWRSLYMTAQRTGVEVLAVTNWIPDWVILDLFSLTNTAVKGRINVNANIITLTNVSSGTFIRTNSLRRTKPLEALTNNAALGVSAMNITNVTDLVLTNVVKPQVFTNMEMKAENTNVFLFAGQVCETATLHAQSGNQEVQERRLRSLANLITVRSEQFTVWAIAQAIQVDPSGKTNIVGESKAQAVVQRVQSPGTDNILGTLPNGFNDDTLAYKVVYFRYLTE
jgi:hypothetical protein